MTAQSKTLLVVMAHSGANEMVQTLWPWYERAGCDILGIGRIGSRWPSSSRLIGHRDEGEDCYNDGTSQLTRFLSVLSDPMIRPYADVCIAEWDTVLLKRLPMFPTRCASCDTMVGTLAGGRSESFRAKQFYHGPWWMDRRTMSRMNVYGKRMLEAGLNEQGFLDRWLGLMADLYGITMRDIGGYSKNALDRPEYIAEARAAIRAGAWAVHGVKTIGQLDQLTDGL